MTNSSSLIMLRYLRAAIRAARVSNYEGWGDVCLELINAHNVAPLRYKERLRRLTLAFIAISYRDTLAWVDSR